jgi:hypothetical protein
MKTVIFRGVSIPNILLFRAEGERKAVVVSYKDPELTLLGRCDLADAQYAADEAAGGLAALVCGYRKGR